MSNLILPPYAACVFVDDTGHEDLAATSFYGLGACAMLGCEYKELKITNDRLLVFIDDTGHVFFCGRWHLDRYRD
jgi:hypothetical protein